MKPRLRLGVPSRCLQMFALLIVSTGFWPSSALAATVHALFDLSTPTQSPFPSDQFTVADSSHNTGLRVNLPKPDCTVRRSDCEDLDVINMLDGFSLQPRLSIPFDGPIDAQTVTSQTVFLFNLDNTLPGISEARNRIGVTRVVWDPATLTLFAEPNEVLKQHTRYVVIVTRGVRGADGSPVEPVPNFRNVTIRSIYGGEILDGLRAASQFGVGLEQMAVASVFSTQSITAVLEKTRDQIKAAVPNPADFLLGPGKTRTVFAVSQIQQIAASRQTGVNPSRFASSVISLDPLNLVPGAVAEIAYGKYVAPEYLTHPGEFIPPVGTRTGTPQVQRQQDVYFDLYLPSGRQPTAGWPVAMFNASGNGVKESALNIVASFAAHGIATIAINKVGNAGGSLGTLTVTQKTGESTTFSAGGRGIDQNGDGTIATREGDFAASPRSLLLFSDGIRQNVADLMQLVRVIQFGVDVHGTLHNDLDPRRIYCFGHSLGAATAIVFAAVEPDVRAAVFLSPAGPTMENFRLAPAPRVAMIGSVLASRMPPLINTPGITSVGGITVGQPFFNENRPLKNQPPVVNTVAGALDIQTFLDRLAWVPEAGNPVAYVAHLRKAPLAGVPVKAVLYLFGKGDQQIPNVNTSETLLTGDLVDRATFYRHDIAFAENPLLPKDSHIFATGFAAGNLFAPGVEAIARAAQEQIAIFLESDGTNIIQPQPVRYFESPIKQPLPDGLNYIP